MLIDSLSLGSRKLHGSQWKCNGGNFLMSVTYSVSLLNSMATNLERYSSTAWTENHTVALNWPLDWSCLTMLESPRVDSLLFFSFQRAEAAQRETESLREQLSSSNQSLQLGSPANADPDTVTTHFTDLLHGWQRGIDRLKISSAYAEGDRLIKARIYGPL